MIDEPDDYRFPQCERAFIRLLLAGDHPRQSGFASAVGADDPDDGAARNAERQVLDQFPLAEAFRDADRVDNDVTQPGPGGDDDLGFGHLGLVLGGHQIVVGGQPGLAFGLAGAWRLADPFQLPCQGSGPGVILFTLLDQAPFLLFQPAGIIALERDALAAVKLKNPSSNVVQKIAVVGHGDDGTGVIGQEFFQPGDGFRIQMIGGLVQQKQVRALQQQPRQRHPAALAPG